jgi:hypothetical protein
MAKGFFNGGIFLNYSQYEIYGLLGYYAAEA